MTDRFSFPVRHVAGVFCLVLAAAFPFSAPAQEAAPANPAPASTVEGDTSPSTQQLEYANGLYARGWFEEAAAEYRRFIEQYPNDTRAADAWYFLGESLFQQDQFAEALEAFNRHLELSPDGEWSTYALFRKGSILYRLDSRKDAITAFQRLIARTDVTPEMKENALLSLGRAYTDTNQTDKALATFQDALRLFPQGELRPHVQFEIARIALVEKDYDKALEAFRNVADDQGEMPEFAAEAAYRVGEILFAQNRFPEAAQAYLRARDNYPESEWQNEAGYGAAWSWYAANEHVRAASAATNLLADLRKPTLRPGTLYVRGLARYAAGQYAEALEDFDTVAAMKKEAELWETLPEDQKRFAEQAPLRAIWSLYETGEYDRLLERTNQWIADGRDQGADGDIRYLSGEAHYKKGMMEAALLDYLDILQNYPESRFRSTAHYRVGWIYYRLQQYDKAAQTLSKFLELYPEHDLASNAMRVMAESHYGGREFEKAAEAFRRYVNQHPNAEGMEETLYRLGLSHYQLRNWDALAQTFSELLDRFPQSKYAGDAAYWLGFVHQQKKEYEQAVDAYNRVIAEYPESAFAQEARKQRAAILFLRGKKEEAAVAYHEMAVAHPEIKLSTQTLLWAGDQLGKSKQYAKAAETYEILAERYPYDDLIELSLFRQGQAWLETQSWDKAIPRFRNLLAEYPEGPFAAEAAFGLGRSLVGKEQYNEAVKPLQTATARSEGELNAKSWLLLGDTWYALDQWDNAKDAYLRADLWNMEEYSPRAIYYAAQSFEKLNRTDRALELYDDLNERFPESPFNGKARERVEALTARTGGAQ